MVTQAFTRLVKLTLRELREAAKRVERQSGLVLRARLRARRWHRKWRNLRRRWRHKPQPPSVGYCEWRAKGSKYGALHWECRWCGVMTLRPNTVDEQRRLGRQCPDAPQNGAERSAQ